MASVSDPTSVSAHPYRWSTAKKSQRRMRLPEGDPVELFAVGAATPPEHTDGTPTFVAWSVHADDADARNEAWSNSEVRPIAGKFYGAFFATIDILCPAGFTPKHLLEVPEQFDGDWETPFGGGCAMSREAAIRKAYAANLARHDGRTSESDAANWTVILEIGEPVACPVSAVVSFGSGGGDGSDVGVMKVGDFRPVRIVRPSAGEALRVCGVRAMLSQTQPKGGEA